MAIRVQKGAFLPFWHGTLKLWAPFGLGPSRCMTNDKAREMRYNIRASKAHETEVCYYICAITYYLCILLSLAGTILKVAHSSS